MILLRFCIVISLMVGVVFGQSTGIVPSYGYVAPVKKILTGEVVTPKEEVLQLPLDTKEVLAETVQQQERIIKKNLNQVKVEVVEKSLFQEGSVVQNEREQLLQRMQQEFQNSESPKVLGIYFERKIQEFFSGAKELEKNTHVQAFVTSIKTPKKVLQETKPENVFINMILVVLYVLVIFYANQLINEMGKELVKDISTWFDKRFENIRNGFNRFSSNHWFHKIGIGIAFVLTGITLSLSDPNYNIFSISSFWFFIFVIISFIIGALAKDLMFYSILKASSKQDVHLQFLGTGYGLSFFSVLINRVIGISPSVVFGNVFEVKHSLISSQDLARYYIKSLIGSLILAGLCWVASTWLIGPWSAVLIGLSFGICNDVFWALNRGEIFWGDVIYMLKPWIWFVMYGGVLLILFQLMLTPGSEISQLQQGLEGNLGKMIQILIGIIVVTGCFVGYAKWFHKKSA